MKKKFLTLVGVSLSSILLLTGCTLPSIFDMADSLVAAIYGDNNNNGNNGNNNNGNNNGNNVQGQNNPDPNNGGQGIATEITQYEDGVLANGPNVIDDGIYFYVSHGYSDITYNEALELVSDSQNYMILGAYAYPRISNKCSETANYDFFSNKSIEYGMYDQQISGYTGQYYDSVLPAYITCFNGYNDEFADSISEFSGKSFLNNDDNPFYAVDEDKKQRIYDELCEEYGETRAEEYYANYLQILSTNYVEFVYLNVDETTGEMTGTSIYGGVYFFEVDDDGVGTLTIADLMIDLNTYEMDLQDPTYWIQYDVVLSEDRSSYILYYSSGFSMEYEKTTDKYLVGYVEDDSKAFHDIVGIEICDVNYYYPNCGAAYLTSYQCLQDALENPRVIMRDGSVAVDPTFEFLDGNMVTISFDAVYNEDLDEEIPYSVSYTVEYALIGFTHDKNYGFVLADGEDTYYFMFSSYNEYADELEGDPDNEPGNEPEGEDDPVDVEIFDGSDQVIELSGYLLYNF